MRVLMLVLRQFLRTDYRGFVALLAEWAEVRRALRLRKVRKVPHYSTLCYAERRLLAGAEKGGPSAGPRPPRSPAPARRGSSAAPRSRRSTRRASTRAA